ncbi:DUF6141 family protein [Pseudogracilibacillus auburnensis]|uniref:DUF6141 family protein n=1 Tax=Pseudogracilibacillus auburnensis TaxID=1494959 RepID=UPI001A976846|nr:DUF6141 family protein [Pseudogracilibacillus auburnensis]MBO1003890.1 hypothetical protein [Pseudogracilibacillus auburnensis]
MKNSVDIIYREVQRPKQLLVFILISVNILFMWYWFIKQIILGVPVGNNSASDTFTIVFWIIFGVLIPLFYFTLVKLIVEVRYDGLYIKFQPFHFKFRHFPAKDILHYEAITYSPLKRFGGWGIRLNFDNEKAYNMSGNEGVELKIKNNVFVIGSQNPEKLKKSLDLVIK